MHRILHSHGARNLHLMQRDIGPHECICQWHVIRATAVPAGTAESAYISYGNSVCPSVCLSRPGTDSNPGKIETPGLHHMVAYRVSSLLRGNLVPLRIRRFPSNDGIKEGYTPLKIVILPLLAHLA